MPGRTDNQCRERWFRAINPNINRGPWTEEEDENIIKYIARCGFKWTFIAKCLGTRRTDSAVKNRWNRSLSRRITRDYMGNLILKEEQKRKSIL